MKKIIRLTEADLARIVRRVIKEEGEMTGNSLTAGKQSIGQGLKSTIDSLPSRDLNGLKPIVSFCKKTNVGQSSQSTYLIKAINNALSGIENPLNVMGGGSVSVVADLFKKYVKTPELACAVMKFYSNEKSLVGYAMFGGDDEDFFEAIYDDSISKINTAEPAEKLINAIYSTVATK